LDSDFAGKLEQLLSNGEAMEKIMAMASSLSSQQNFPPEKSAEDNSEEPRRSTLGTLPLPAGRSGYSAILLALKPYLDDERKDRVDKLISMIRIAETAKMLLRF